MAKSVLIATLGSGTLDILFAIILTLLFGRQVDAMLRYVASGPFPAATDMGTAGALLGLLVHFALMAVMATIFFWLVRQRPQLAETPLRTGIAFGLATYLAMNWVAVPLRFGTPLPPKPISIATQLFAHVVLVGLVFAFIAAKERRSIAKSSEAAGAAA